MIQSPATTEPPRTLAPADQTHLKGRLVLDELVALFIDTYPAFRPNYAECTFVMSCLYAVSVRHSISPGQWKTMDLLRKKLEAKGIPVAPRTKL